MPTILTHSIVGMVACKTLPKKVVSRRMYLLSVVLTILPDTDVIGFALGIEYGDFLGHRGFIHSIPFAFILAAFAVSLFLCRNIASKKWWLLTGFFFVITASHGILDACTNGGLGIALLSPFDDTRYFMPFTPIQVAPIGIANMFIDWRWGLSVIISEAKYVWLPISLIALYIQYAKKVYAPAPTDDELADEFVGEHHKELFTRFKAYIDDVSKYDELGKYIDDIYSQWQLLGVEQKEVISDGEAVFWLAFNELRKPGIDKQIENDIETRKRLLEYLLAMESGRLPNGLEVIRP